MPRPGPIARAMLAFIGVCLVLWVVGGGIPYGFDGIEIYFTYLIGYNAATFPQANPLVADIAATPRSAAHPYSYTHHPNLFAHLISWALIRGGVADLRWHGLVAILLSALGIYVGARCLREMAGESEAIAYVAISSLHYVGVLTWAPVLLRSVHFLVFWLGIWLVQRHLVAPSPPGLVATALWTYAVFLNDFTLGLFLFIAQVMLILLRGASWRFWWWFVAVDTSAMVAAIATWIGVLSHRFGRDVVLQDIAYTYIARNAGGLLANRDAVVDFYQRNRIVFWNVVPTDGFFRVSLEAWGRALDLGHGLLAVAVYALVIYALVQSLMRRARGERARAETGVAPVWRTTWAGAATLTIRLAIAVVAMAGPAGLAAFALGRFRTARALLAVALGAGATLVIVAGAAWVTRAAALRGTGRKGEHVDCAGDSARSRRSGPLLAAAAGLGIVVIPLVRPEWFPAGLGAMVAVLVALASALVLQVATDCLATGREEAVWPNAAVWLGAAAVGIAVLLALDSRLLIDLEEAAAKHRALELADVVGQLRHFGRAGFAAAAAVAAGAVLWWRRRGRIRPALVAGVPVYLAVLGLLGAAAIALAVLREAWGLYGFRAVSPDTLRQDAVYAGWVFAVLLAATAALVAVYVRMRTAGSTGRAAETAGGLDNVLDLPGARGVTLRAYVLALVTAILVLSVTMVGPFTGNFVFTYKPCLVFLEDVALAVLAVHGVRLVRRVPATSYRRAGWAFVLGAAACYWLSYQGVLLHRYPPTELSIARALKGEMFRGASFVEEAMYSAIWYYTRGTAHSVPWNASGATLDFDSLMFFHDRDERRSDYHRPQYIACVRQHIEAAYACDRWVRYLETLGYVLKEGETILYQQDYMIFLNPNGIAPDG